jgi:hypothetical protein
VSGASVMQHPLSSHDSPTRLKLMDVAERLSAEPGNEAGQRNTSALHYHFGPKVELANAIFARRMWGINHCRIHLLYGVD